MICIRKMGKTNKNCGTGVDFEMISSSCVNVSHTRCYSTPTTAKLVAFCFHLIVPLHSMRGEDATQPSSTQLIFAMEPTIYFFCASLTSQLISLNCVLFFHPFIHLLSFHIFRSFTSSHRPRYHLSNGHNCIDA